LLELDRHVAGVEADADVMPEEGFAGGPVESRQRGQPLHGGSREQMLLEERYRLRDRLHVAEGLGLEREGDALAGALPDAVERRGVLDDQLAHAGGVRLVPY